MFTTLTGGHIFTGDVAKHRYFEGIYRILLVFIDHSAKTLETPIETEGKENIVKIMDQQVMNNHYC